MILSKLGLTFHNGIWLPIYLSAAADGGVLVEIGIKSKAFQAAFALKMVRSKQVEKRYKSITGQSYKAAVR